MSEQPEDDYERERRQVREVEEEFAQLMEEGQRRYEELQAESRAAGDHDDDYLADAIPEDWSGEAMT